MIEQAIVRYLNADAPLVALLGGTKIYYGRGPLVGSPPMPPKMPYVVVKNSGGMRERVTQMYTDINDTLTIYVEAGDGQQFLGRDIAERILVVLENYRGDMAPELDLHIRCGSIRDLDGYQNSYRFIVTAYVLYKQTTAFPV